MHVVAIPAFNDNYIWLVCVGNCAVAIDPGCAAPLLSYIKRYQIYLEAILITHHHHDHVGGLTELTTHLTCPVYGPPGIVGVNRVVADGDRLNLSSLPLSFEVLSVPGHTLDHLAYYGESMLFCGDTLFACGCGRLFEGVAAQLLSSLERLAALDGATQVYCAHEYTLANERFALQVEADNAMLQRRYHDDQQRRQQQLPTLPSSIALERATNPFLRCHEATVAQRVQQVMATPNTLPLTIFTALRHWKDHN